MASSGFLNGSKLLAKYIYLLLLIAAHEPSSNLRMPQRQKRQHLPEGSGALVSGFREAVRATAQLLRDHLLTTLHPKPVLPAKPSP